MIKSTERLREAIRNTKSLRLCAVHPDKAKQHRYERRKVRTYIRLGAWAEADMI